MFIRRKTLERMLTDRDRAGARDRDTLLHVIADQNDRIAHLAGRQYTLTPLQLDEPVAVLLDEPGESYPDPEQLPDDLGPDPY